MAPVTLYFQSNCLVLEALKAIKFLRDKKIAFPTVKITQNNQDVLDKSTRINLVDSTDQQKRTVVLRKTNIAVKLQIGQKTNLSEVLNALSKATKKLISLCGLYPCPKTYALFTVLKNRMGPTTVNTLL
jgi:hypothetical protein